MGEYNVFQINRMPVAEKGAQFVFCFENRLYSLRTTYEKAVIQNIDPLNLHLQAGHIANLDHSVDEIFESCALYIKRHSAPSEEANRSICFDILAYIGEKFGRMPGAAWKATYFPTRPDIERWRQNGSVPAYEFLNWVLDRLTHVPITEAWSICELFELCCAQFFDPHHPCIINIESLGDNAADSARSVHFHMANHATLQRLRRCATTGVTLGEQIVCIFVGLGKGGRFSFFFVCSPYAYDRSDDASIARLMLAVAQTRSFALLFKHLPIAFSERVSQNSFLSPDHLATYKRYKARSPLTRQGRRISEFEHDGFHNEFVRYLNPFYWPTQQMRGPMVLLPTQPKPPPQGYPQEVEGGYPEGQPQAQPQARYCEHHW
jgi:hypothetical protein